MIKRPTATAIASSATTVPAPAALADVSVNRHVTASVQTLGREWQRLIDIRLICLLVILLALGAWRGEIVTVTLVGCLLLTLLGPESVIKALSIMIILKFLNQELLRFNAADAALAWMILFAAAFRILPFYLASALHKTKWLLIYCAVTAAMALFVSASPLISLMKLLSFFLSAATILAAFNAMRIQSVIRLQRWLVSLFVALLALSVPLYAIPSIGYAINGRGFQGILNQPQALAIVIAPFAAWLVASIFLRKHKNTGFLSGIALIGILVILISTKARTAALAVVLANLATVLVILASARYRHHARSSGKKLIGALMIVCSFVVAGILLSGQIADAAQHYLLKGQTEDVEDAFYHSRGANIKTQWQNFLESPLAGHGFGIYPGGMPSRKITYFMGIPISASTEKGFLPTAALEETGLAGFALLTMLLISLGRQVYRQYDPRWLAMYFACLFVNFGEAVFFSSGGLGLFFWVLIGLSTRGSQWRRAPCAT